MISRCELVKGLKVLDGRPPRRAFGGPCATREASSRTLARERVLFVRCLNLPSHRVVAKAAAVKAAVVARPAEVPRDFRKGSPCQ